jgi:regulator of sigma E protease
LQPLDPFPPIVKTVSEGFPGEKAGLRENDKIISVDNHPVYSRSELIDYVQPKNGEAILLGVERDSKTLELSVTPIAKRLEDGKVVGFIGIEFAANQKPPAEFLHVQKFGPFAAFKQACKQTLQYTVFTLEMLKKMIIGSVSLKHLSGPVAIAQYAGRSVSVGIEYFLNFLAVISISLGIINILPIPLLDGGHIMYCVWELIVGKPVSERTQIFGLWLGGSFILAITLIALYNDLTRF